MGERKRILITAMTYPRRSRKHREVVCTGGVLEDGRLIRLHPINVRDLSHVQRFRKYQWVEMEIEKNLSDPRSESYRPSFGKRIGIISKPISGWRARMRWVLQDRSNLRTMCELSQGDGKVKSLGVVQPAKIEGIRQDYRGSDWPEEMRQLLLQQGLFGVERKPLDWIPYQFKVNYRCGWHECNGHSQTIIDGEVFELYRKVRRSAVDAEGAAERVREHLLNRVFAPDRQPYFYVGNMYRWWTSWLIVGIMWPKKAELAQVDITF